MLEFDSIDGGYEWYGMTRIGEREMRDEDGLYSSLPHDSYSDDVVDYSVGQMDDRTVDI